MDKKILVNQDALAMISYENPSTAGQVDISNDSKPQVKGVSKIYN